MRPADSNRQLYFRLLTYVRPHWAPRMTKLTKIGLHVFYQFKRGWKYG